ncbi:MAG: hypothetical protein J7484_13445 [Microbacterium sp.]|nr:hypothetical protein [Microbacterium sp.]
MQLGASRFASDETGGRLTREAAGAERSEQRPITVRLNRALSLAVVFIVAGIGVQGVLSARVVYGDGAYYLYEIIQTRTFVLVEPVRLFLDLIYQSLPVAAVKLGVTDIRTLMLLFAIGSIGLTIGVWLAALIIARPRGLFWPVAVAFAVVALNTGWMSNGERNLHFALVVLSLVLILVVRESKTWAIGTLLTAAVLVMSYESMLFLGPLLALAALTRRFGHRRLGFPDRGRMSDWVLPFAAALYLLGAAVSAISVIAPRDPRNLEGATAVIQTIAQNPQLLLSGVAGGFALFIGIVWRKAAWVAGVLSLATSALILFWPAIWFQPWMSYSARTVCALWLAAWVVATWLWTFRGSAAGLRIWPALAGVALVIAQAVPFYLHSDGFGRWLSVFQAHIPASGATEIPAVLQPSAGSPQYLWPWTNEYLSQLLATPGHQGYILSPKDYRSPDAKLPSPLGEAYLSPLSPLTR